MATGAATGAEDTAAVLLEIATATGRGGAGRSKVRHISSLSDSSPALHEYGSYKF